MTGGRLADLAFRRLPLACLAAAAVAGGVLDPEWSVRAAPIPCLVALAIVSIGAYLVVTPAHELSGGMLVGRSSTEPTASCPRRSVSCSA